MKELDNGGDLTLAGVALGTTASIETTGSGAAIGQMADFKENEISPSKGNGAGTMAVVTGTSGASMLAATSPGTPVTKEDYSNPAPPTGVGTEHEGDVGNFAIGGSDENEFHDADGDVGMPLPPGGGGQLRPRVDTVDLNDGDGGVAKAEDIL